MTDTDERDDAPLLERLFDECDFLRTCRPKVDDDSQVWLRLADLERLLELASTTVRGGA